ncbi:MAG: AMP-binding protein [Bacteroidota bacterium]
MNKLINGLEKSIQNYPSLPAIQADDLVWTYQQLGDYSEQLKTKFPTWGLKEGHRIGILLPKSFPFVSLIVAALKYAIPYVPLDIESPVDRLGYIINHADCRTIVTTKEQGAQLLDKLTRIEKSFYLEAEQLYVIIRTTQTEKSVADLAYILFTSGSTGYPKGVMISHANALCFIKWSAETFGLAGGDTLASIAPFHFDLSVYDLYVGLFAGAKLLLFRQDQCRNPRLLAQWLAEKEVNSLYATPSLLQLLLRYGRLNRYDFSKLRTVLFAGEVFPVLPLRKLQTIWRTANFYNLYGPTETNVVSWQSIPNPIPEDQTEVFPIGTLCPFAEARIGQEDKILEPTAGLTGELLISGESVTLGYLSPSPHNANAFIMYEGKRWYKTGDWVNLDNKIGTIYTYAGRKDRMVKRNGYRIELAEIEQKLAQYPGISTVVAIESVKNNRTQITVFFQSETEHSSPALLEWKQFSTQKLPTYMVPDRFIQCDDWPHTASQKIDLQALSKRVQSDV